MKFCKILMMLQENHQSLDKKISCVIAELNGKRVEMVVNWMVDVV